MEIQYSSKFKKQYKKLPKKIREQFRDRLTLFVENQHHPQLRVHKLSGNFEDLWSINISGDIRAIFDKHEKEIILFIAIGSHSELYD